MSVYAVEELMKQTRRLAADYYRTTQQTLPVSNELAKYDACRLLNLTEVNESVKGVDAIDAENTPILIKSRVIFKDGNNSYRVGQFNTDGEWQKVVLVLFDPDYEPFEIHALSRAEFSESIPEKTNEKRAKRGPMSVAKFKNIGELIWTRENGLEPSN